MNSMLSGLDYKLQNPFKDSEKVREVYQQVQKRVNQERPKIDEFEGVVSREKILADKKDVAKMEEYWNKTNDQEVWDVKMKSEIAEYLIYKNIGGWIDYKAVPLLTEKSDDYLRGVDLVIESEDNQKDVDHLGIGIDIALTSDKKVSTTFERKKEKMKQMLATGKMTEARYVSGGSFTGSITHLPYTLLSVSSSHVESLFSKTLMKTPSVLEQQHILKHIVAYQTVLQLNTYTAVAQAYGHERMAYEYAKANNFAVEIFSDLNQKLYQDEKLWQKVAADQGMQEISAFCDSLKYDLTKNK
jgi:hypothetical protein